jgi:hypothetical protein
MLFIIYLMSDDERSFSLWHTNQCANRGNPNSVLKATPCTLDVPRWRGDLKAGRCPRSSRCVRRSERRGGPGSASRIERDVETNPSRIAVRRRVGRAAVYVCVRAVRVPVDITDHTHTHTGRVRTRHAWQQPRRREAVAAPAASAGTLGTRPPAHRCSPPVGGPHPRPNTINPLT